MVKSFIESVKSRYRFLKSKRPGQRFSAYAHAFGSKRRPIGKVIFYICIVIVCWAIAIPLMVLPGPAFIFWIAGLCFLIPLIPVLGKVMDKWETVLRKAIKR